MSPKDLICSDAGREKVSPKDLICSDTVILWQVAKDSIVANFALIKEIRMPIARGFSRIGIISRAHCKNFARKLESNGIAGGRRKYSNLLNNR